MSASNNQPDQCLPDDIAVLKQIIAEKDKALAIKTQRIYNLEEYIRLQKQKTFGASSEKSPDQQELFNEAESSGEDLLAEPQQETVSTAAQPVTAKKKPGRKPLPAELPRIRIEYDLSEDDKRCACGCERTLIGEETCEQLDVIPAKVQVLVHVRKKYACKQCEAGVKTAPLPPQPISKSNASAGLLAHIAVAKYQDALPLHRQEAVLSRSGIKIPRNTLANWMIKAGDLIQPLINLLEDKQLAYPVMHCDETTVQILDEPDKKATSKSYMWVRVGGPPTQPIRLFHYADSRSSEVARSLMEGYAGYLQTDDYADIMLWLPKITLPSWAAGRMPGESLSKPGKPPWEKVKQQERRMWLSA